MALRLKRGTAAELAAYTPLEGELIYVTDQGAIYAGDGSTVGGKLLASGSEIIDNIDLNGNDIVGTGNINITGNIHASGNITADGNITLGTGNDDEVIFAADISSSLIPNVDNTYNLGTNTKKWGTIYADTVEAGQVNADTMGFHEGDVKGSVFADNSVQLLDGLTGKVVGPIETSTISASAGITGNLIGDVTGNVTGNVAGNVAGAVVGEFTGLLKSSSGVTVGDTGSGGEGAFNGQFYGDLHGSVFPNDSGLGGFALIDGNENSVNLNGTIKNHVVASTASAWDLGYDQTPFRNLFLGGSGRIQMGDWPYTPEGNIPTISVDSSSHRMQVKGGIANQLPVTTTLNGAVPGPASRSTFTVASTNGIRPGAVFSLPGVSLRTVASAIGGVITTTETFSVSAGATSNGETIKFYNPAETGATYRHAIPTSSIGEPGDVEGMIFADGNYIYVCTASYDGIANIWKRSAVSGTSW